jgi:hypothetical protein
MAGTNEYDDFDKKLNLSEGTVHVRESEKKDKKKVEGYEPNPQDEKYYEVMGLKNSFDNLSVGTDKYGQMLISVNSLKEPGRPTLNSDRKKLKGPRRKKKIDAFGDFYTNLGSDRDGAFGFRADRNISEIRMVREFERIARKRVSREQREAAPFLRLEEDQAELSALRGKSGSGEEGLEEREALEKRVRKETEYRDRFMHRIRKARRKTYDTRDLEDERNSLFGGRALAGDSGGEDEDEDDEDDEIIDDIIDDILDDDDPLL